jgi:hypothetical protein
MLRLSNNTDILRDALAHEGLSKADFEQLDAEVKAGQSRVLVGYGAAGVVQVLKTKTNEMVLFLRAWGGYGLVGYLKDLIEFTRLNGLNYLEIQTKNKKVFNILTHRYKFEPRSYLDGNFIMERAI